MNLRQEFDDILAQYGYNALLVREDKRLRCSCWNEKTQEADRECPVCYGLGWTPVVEKHTIRDMDTSVPETLALLGELASLGQVAVPGRFYYMRHDVQVEPQNLIIEVDWSLTGKPIYNGGGVFEVSHVDTRRFERGEAAYKKVYCKDQPIEKQIRGVRIVNSNGIKNYEILRG